MGSFYSLACVSGCLDRWRPEWVRELVLEAVVPGEPVPSVAQVKSNPDWWQRLAPWVMERVLDRLPESKKADKFRSYLSPDVELTADVPLDAVLRALADSERPGRIGILSGLAQRWWLAHGLDGPLPMHRGAVAHTEGPGDRRLLEIYRVARRTPEVRPVMMMALDTYDPVQALLHEDPALPGLLPVAGNGLYDAYHSPQFELHFLSPPQERMDEMVLARFVKTLLPGNAFWVYAADSLSAGGRTLHELLAGIAFPGLEHAVACVTGWQRGEGAPHLKIGASDWSRGRELASLLTGAVPETRLVGGAPVETYQDGAALSVSLCCDPALVQGQLLYDVYRDLFPLVLGGRLLDHPEPALADFRRLLERLEGIPPSVVDFLFAQEPRAAWRTRAVQEKTDHDQGRLEAMVRRIYDGRLTAVPPAERPQILASLGEPALGTATAIGERSNQEDAVLIREGGLPGRLTRVALIADGHGDKWGAAASREALRTFYNMLIACVQQDQDPREAIAVAHGAMERMVAQNLPTAGSTLIAALQFGDRTFVVHIGDSRAYHLLPGQALRQITTDHKWPVKLARGLYLFGMAMARSVGDSAKKEWMPPEYRENASRYDPPLELPSEGTLLLCTDGVSEVLSEAAMQAEISAYPPQQAAQRIIAAARSAGARDNTLVAVISLDAAGTT